MTSARLEQIESNLALLREQLHSLEQTQIISPAEDRLRIGQRIRLEIQPQIAKYEEEYWSILAGEADSLEVSEQEAEVVVAEIVEQVDQLEIHRPPDYSDELLQTLKDVRKLIRESDSSASSKLKGVFSSFPPFVGVSYEAELDTEKFFQRHFPSFIRIVKNMAQKKTSIDPESHPDPPQVDLSLALSEVKSKLRGLIEEQCGKMKVLDMTQPVEIDDIFTNVNILERISSKTWGDIDEMNERDFDRYRLGEIIGSRVDAIEAIDKYPRSMILGKPGSGKTFLLKRLAKSCIANKIYPDIIPVFVSLREYSQPRQKSSNTILNYIEQIWNRCGISSKTFMSLLSKGKLMFLLDGLDEVNHNRLKSITDEISWLLRHYPKNIYLITCRIAAHEYVFENFSEIEIADFDKDQIRDFSVKWWYQIKQDPERGDLFLGKLSENEAIFELANKPLLLTLLCVAFEEGNFPRNIAEFYEEGLDVLLKKWDATRNIERFEVYKDLSVQRKKDLLSQIAKRSFKNEEKLFFKKDWVIDQILRFIRNLSRRKMPESELEKDSKAILQLIESQHGLLIERAVNIYSFSHLTFQEYFVARHIVNSCNPYLPEPRTLKELSDHLHEKRWEEVIKLTFNLLTYTDNFADLIKEKNDRLITGNPKLERFFVWVNEKSSTVETNCSPLAVRTVYFVIGRIRVRNLDLSIDHDFEFDKTLARDLDLARKIDGSLDMYQENELQIDIEFDRALIRANTLSNKFDRRMFLALIRVLYRVRTRLAKVNDSNLEAKTYEIEKLLPPTSSTGSRIAYQQEWWQSYGQWWTNELRQLMIEYRNLGQYWDLEEDEKADLQSYFRGINLIVTCMQGECYITPEKREKIENSFFSLAG